MLLTSLKKTLSNVCTPTFRPITVACGGRGGRQTAQGTQELLKLLIRRGSWFHKPHTGRAAVRCGLCKPNIEFERRRQTKATILSCGPELGALCSAALWWGGLSLSRYSFRLSPKPGFTEFHHVPTLTGGAQRVRELPVKSVSCWWERTALSVEGFGIAALQ